MGPRAGGVGDGEQGMGSGCFIANACMLLYRLIAAVGTGRAHVVLATEVGADLGSELLTWSGCK